MGTSPSFGHLESVPSDKTMIWTDVAKDVNGKPIERSISEANLGVLLNS